MFKLKNYSQLLLLIIGLSTIFTTSCIKPSAPTTTATLLETKDAPKEKLISEVNRFAKVTSMRAKVDVRFEDNSFATEGIAEKYKTADGEIVIQRPANILLKVSVPIVKYDVAQMTSDGTKFRVAILNDGGSGKNKKFVIGTNNADYTKLQKDLNAMDLDIDKSLKQQVSAFANLRPQHFTDAMLVRSTDNSNAYTFSTIFQDEPFDSGVPIEGGKRKLSARVLRGYYLLDEYRKSDNSDLVIARRFWFDRVGGIRLARQQIFDVKGEIETDVVYGQEGNLADNPEFTNLPLQISVTRPKERYKMSLTYQTPEKISIGKSYPIDAFVLQNTWNLPEVDLDKKLSEVKGRQSASNTATSNKQ